MGKSRNLNKYLLLAVLFLSFLWMSHWIPFGNGPLINNLSDDQSQIATNACYSYDYITAGTIPDNSPNSYAKIIDIVTDGAGISRTKVLELCDGSDSGWNIVRFYFQENGSQIARNGNIEFCLMMVTEGPIFYHSYLGVA